jgi:glutamate N-acetyltransferase/amino-acid N-acetyltransferase
VHAGIRYRERPDLALIAADSEAVAAGVFTRNQFAAAPVLLCREHLKRGQARAILVNAGIANACTGEEGLHAAREMASMVAQGLGAPREAILVASTGVIGPQIPLPAIDRTVPKLIENLRSDAWEDVARAIMTTDTVPKQASVQMALGDHLATITGVAKGAGMIAPNMATLLVFVASDVAVSGEVLQELLRDAAEASFNRITIDGDTSTNDTLLALAGGRAGNPPITDAASEAGRVFAAGLQAVLVDLAKQIVRDGEGATKFIEVRIVRAADAGSARQVALTIANSPLVKTALFGEDANWGRVVAAAGRAGVAMDPARVALFFDEVCVFREGKPVAGPEVEAEASRVFKGKEITIRLDLGAGDAGYSAYTCDLSYDYIKINASYRS